MNILNDPNITLEQETHTYLLADDPTFSFVSSTTFIHKFFEPFDKYKIANKLVNMPKYRGRTVKSFIDEWKGSSDRGSAVHEELETYILRKEEPVSLPAKHGKAWLSLFSENMELIPETILFSKELIISGMADLLLHNKEEDTYTIVDWKTSKRIDMKAFKGKKGIRKATRDIEDCNFNQYSLQLSLYRYILETYYGLKVTSQILVHVTDSGAVSYNCPYMKDTLEKMFEEEGLV
jgi:ATP-dependent exoDNAse (exonuclease V) beta subunit